MQKLKYFYQKHLKKSAKTFADNILSDVKMIGADVGAAYGLPPHWRPLNGALQFYTFEPHPGSYQWLLDYYSKSKYPDCYNVLNIGLSKNGGEQTLYILNAETGSSLLPVNMDSPLVDKKNSYIFPITEQKIQTRTLKSVMEEYKEKTLDIIKLDIQGAELEVLKGLGENYLNNLIAIELEVGFDSIYKGAPKPIDVENFLKDYGLEFYDLHPVRLYPHKNGSSKAYLDTFNVAPLNNNIAGKLVECDMLFFRNSASLLAEKNQSAIRKLIIAYCTYNYFFHAVQLTEKAAEQGIFSTLESEKIIKNIKLWHTKIFKHWYNNSFFYSILKKLEPILKFGQYKGWQEN